MESERNRRISAAILAGGRSRRFGAEKSGALLEGKPLIEHVFDTLRPLADEVLLSLRTGAARPELPNAIPVYDAYRDAGPLAGIHACLQMAANPWLLVIACDLPRVRMQTLERLLDARSPESRVVLSAAVGGRLQPLCGCYHASLAGDLENALYEERFGVLDFIGTIAGVVRVDVPAEELLNVNRPEDL